MAIDKPAGFHTHPPEDKTLRIHPRWNAQGILERQLGERLAPIHRLDRAASGLLLYARHRDAARGLQEQFSSRAVEKTYYVLARGRIEGSLTLDAPLESENGGARPALTRAQACFSFTLPIPHPRGGPRSFTVLEARPETGRFHQLRRHFAGAGFPLLGCTRHGDRKLNREFAVLTGCRGLFLRCMALSFTCPETGQPVELRTKWSREWHRLFDLAGACGLAAGGRIRDQTATASPSPAPRSPS